MSARSKSSSSSGISASEISKIMREFQKSQSKSATAAKRTKSASAKKKKQTPSRSALMQHIKELEDKAKASATARKKRTPAKKSASKKKKDDDDETLDEIGRILEGKSPGTPPKRDKEDNDAFARQLAKYMGERSASPSRSRSRSGSSSSSGGSLDSLDRALLEEVARLTHKEKSLEARVGHKHRMRQLRGADWLSVLGKYA